MDTTEFMMSQIDWDEERMSDARQADMDIINNCSIRAKHKANTYICDACPVASKCT